MKAALFRAPGQFEVCTVPDPECGPRDIVMKVLACGICGSDLHTLRTGEYVDPGQIMGHEFAGRVEAAGAAVEGVRAGDRMTGFSAHFCGECYWCRNRQRQYCPHLFSTGTGYGRPGAFAEYVRLENAVVGRNCFHLPERLSDHAGALVEPVGVAAMAARQADLPAGQRVVVMGAGLIGNAVAQILKRTGGHKVAVSEPSDLRRRTTRAHGIDVAVDPLAVCLVDYVQELWGKGPYHFGTGGMADLAVDCAGASNTFAEALELVRSGGTVALVALPDRPAPVNISRIVHKGPRIVGVLGSHMPQAIELLSSGVVRTEGLITHEFPLAEIQQAFAVQQDATVSVKVLVRP